MLVSIIIKRYIDPTLYSLKNDTGQKIAWLVENAPERFSRLNAQLQSIGSRVAWPTTFKTDAEENITQITMENLPGITLRDFFQKVQFGEITSTDKELKDLCMQLASSLYILWKNGIFLFDPNPSNFLYDQKTGTLGIIDIESSAYIQTEQGFLPPLSLSTNLHEDLVKMVQANNQGVPYESPIEEQYVIDNIRKALQCVPARETVLKSSIFSKRDFNTAMELLRFLNRMKVTVIPVIR